LIARGETRGKQPTIKHVMFDIDLANNPNTALTAGTAGNKTFSLVSPPSGGRSLRSVAAQILSEPLTLEIAHSTRSLKGLRYAATSQVAPDIILDSHMTRFDWHTPLTTLGIADPSFACKTSARLVIEVPRAGADTPTTQEIMDLILRNLVLLNPSTNAGLVRLLNGEG
jgi:hypothetical protein